MAVSAWATSASSTARRLVLRPAPTACHARWIATAAPCLARDSAGVPTLAERAAVASSARATATRSGPCGRTSQPDMQTSQDHAAAAAVTATAVPTSCGCSGSSAQTAQAKVGISPAGGPVRTASETSLVSPATSATTRDAATKESLKAATDVPGGDGQHQRDGRDREQLGLRAVRLVAGVERGEATERRERQQAQVVGDQQEHQGHAHGDPGEGRRGDGGVGAAEGERSARSMGSRNCCHAPHSPAVPRGRLPGADLRLAGPTRSRRPARPAAAHRDRTRSPYSGSTASTATSPRMRAASTTAA